MRHDSTQEARAVVAALCFADGLAVGAEDFVFPGAPIEAAGELIIFLREALVIHLLAAHMTAGQLELRRVCSVTHKG